VKLIRAVVVTWIGGVLVVVVGVAVGSFVLLSHGADVVEDWWARR